MARVGSLFVPDGTFTPRGVDGTVLVRMAGREDIARKIDAAVGSATAIHHLFSYANANRYPWRPSHDRTPAIEPPAGFTFLSGDAYPPGVDVDGRVQAFLDGPTRGWFNPVYTKAHRKGGHFVPWENPDAVIEDVRATFRGLRRQ